MENELSAPEEFKVKPGGFKNIRKLVLIRTIPLLIIIFVLVMVIPNRDVPIDTTVIFIVIPVFALTTFIGLRRSMRQQQKIHESYVLRFEGDKIVRTQFNTPAIAMPLSEITAIIKNKNGSFTIKGNSLINVIGVPAQIDNYTQVESRLNSIKPLTIQTKGTYTYIYTLLASLLAVGLMLCVYSSTNKLIVGISGTLLLVFLGYSLVITQKNKNLSSRVKRSSWWVIVVALSILASMVVKLMR